MEWEIVLFVYPFFRYTGHFSGFRDIAVADGIVYKIYKSCQS